MIFASSFVGCKAPADATVDKATLAAIGGLSPETGTETTDSTPTLTWTAVEGAESYEMQIAPTEAALADTPATSVKKTSYTFDPPLTNGDVRWWRVRAISAKANPSEWTAARSVTVRFTTFHEFSPVSGASVTDTKPTITWNTVESAASYEIAIASSEAALAGTTSIACSVNSWTSTTPLTNLATYYWRVRATDKSGNVLPWSAAQSFTVSWGAVSLASPPAGAVTFKKTPTLAWNATSGAVAYEFAYATGESELDSATAIPLMTTDWTPASNLSNNTNYWWRVRAKDADGQFGPWSNKNTLLVSLGTISGMLPDSTSSTPSLVDSTPTLSWNAFANATYLIQYATTEAALASAAEIPVSTNAYTFPAPLANKATYYWRAKAIDSSGTPANWGSSRSFKIDWGTTGPSDGIRFASELREIYSLGSSYWGGTYALEADIDLEGANWNPIGTNTTSFSGTFDGKGHKITGLKIVPKTLTCYGLFGSIGGTGTVKNLTLSAVDVSGDTYIGAIAGICYGTIANCSVSGTVSSSTNNVGGIAGYLATAAGSTTAITNCQSEAAVSGTGNLGGIVGYLESASGSISILFSGNTSKGQVTGTSNNVGGCIGNIFSNGGVFTIENSSATGNVTTTAGICGGFIGNIRNGTAGNAITSCWSSGTATCGSTGFAGGFVGMAYTTSVTYPLTIELCHASGTVTGTNSNFIGGFAGTIGFDSSNLHEGITVARCYATGTATGNEHIGGFVAVTASGNPTANCYASGNVIAKASVSYVGGFCGEGAGTISNCYSMGTVSGGASKTGGFLGYGGSTMATTCYYDREKSTKSDTTGGTKPLYSADMIDRTKYVGWDFAGDSADGTKDIWAIDPDGNVNSGYPYLAALKP